MKEYPQDVKQWAEEAYQAMVSAWDDLTRHTPFPSDSQKEQLIKNAVSIACDNRDISDLKFIAHAQDFTNDAFMTDYISRDIVTKINFSVCFLLAYFDAHLALSMITQEESDDAMAHLRTHYDLSYTGKTQSNVLSINYSEKS